MDGVRAFDSLLQLCAASAGEPPNDIADIFRDLNYVEKTWCRIKAVLADAEEREIREEPVRLWLRELRALSYEAEDILDLYSYRQVAVQVRPAPRDASASTSSRKRKARHLRSPLRDVSFRKEIAHAVKKIRKKFDEIARRREALRLRESDQGSPACDPHSGSTSTPREPDLFVGREGSLEDLLSMLLANGGEELEVIAVVGMGGVGKTTLSQRAYFHGGMAQFDLKGWVHVGERFDVVRVTNGILNSFAGGELRYDQLSILQQEVVGVVQGKRSLLVLDDVWSQNLQDWDAIRALFADKAGSGSKILITTRNEAVAGIAGATGLLKLGCLWEEDGWSLFKQFAFRDGCPRQLVDVGRSIAMKCGGLPLAIKVLGSLLRSKGEDLDSWRGILESDLWDVPQIEGGREILGSLYLSYLHLPPQLKACFRFFSLFKKGEEITPQDLVHLWIAHDLVRDDGNTASEDIADKLVNDLISRSFLDVDVASSESVEGNTYMIKVHDLIHDVAQYVSGNEFWNEEHLKADGRWSPATGARHLMLELSEDSGGIHVGGVGLRSLMVNIKGYGDDEHGPQTKLHVSHMESLRVLAVCGENLQDCLQSLKLVRLLRVHDREMEVTPKSLYSLYNLRLLDLSDCPIVQLSVLIGNLKSLRLLDLSCTHIHWIPESLFTLDNMRVLKLRHTFIRKLPESLSNLSALQELDLQGCEDLECLPGSVTRLTNLRSLNAKDTSVFHMPSGLSGLARLRHLPYFPIGFGSEHAGLKEMKNFHLRKTLHIANLGNLTSEEDAKEVKMFQRAHLHQLNLTFELTDEHEGNDLQEEGNGSEEISLHQEHTLEHLRPHTNLKKLEIMGYQGVKLPLWMGDQSFGNLVHISLEDFSRCKTISPLYKLPSLEHLCLLEMTCLAELIPEQNWEWQTSSNVVLKQEHGLYFQKLEYLQICGCHSIEFLPLYKFTALKELFAWSCECLKCIEFVDPAIKEENVGGVAYSSLRRLKFSGCPQLCFSDDTPLPRSLEHLDVHGCEGLRSWCERNRDS